MAARANAKPAAAKVRAETEADHDELAEAEPAPQPRQARGQTIPAVEDFPPIAQKQIAAQQGRIENIAEHSARKKKGLFERLASVGLGRRDDPVADPKEPVMSVRPAKAQAAPQSRTAQLQVQIDPGLDDDQLEIPAFLRRQAN